MKKTIAETSFTSGIFTVTIKKEKKVVATIFNTLTGQARKIVTEDLTSSLTQVEQAFTDLI